MNITYRILIVFHNYHNDDSIGQFSVSHVPTVAYSGNLTVMPFETLIDN